MVSYFKQRRALAFFALIGLCAFVFALSAREREPNNVYAARRSQLAAKIGAPLILFGFTGDENSSPSYVFNQEENFYYLTGLNEEGAALLLLPPNAAQKGWNGPREILFLQPRDSEKEKWNGARMAPDDSGVAEKTGFPSVEAITGLKGRLA